MIGREKRKNHCLTSQRLANQQQLSRQNIFEGKKGEEVGKTTKTVIACLLGRI